MCRAAISSGQAGGLAVKEDEEEGGEENRFGILILSFSQSGCFGLSPSLFPTAPHFSHTPVLCLSDLSCCLIPHFTFSERYLEFIRLGVSPAGSQGLL